MARHYASTTKHTVIQQVRSVEDKLAELEQRLENPDQLTGMELEALIEKRNELLRERNSAWRAFVTQYFQHLLSILGNPQYRFDTALVEDFAQEFLFSEGEHAIGVIRKYDRNQGRFHTFLNRKLKWFALDKMSQRSRMPIEVQYPESELPDEHETSEEWKHHVWATFITCFDDAVSETRFDLIHRGKTRQWSAFLMLFVEPVLRGVRAPTAKDPLVKRLVHEKETRVPQLYAEANETFFRCLQHLCAAVGLPFDIDRKDFLKLMKRPDIRRAVRAQIRQADIEVRDLDEVDADVGFEWTSTDAIDSYVREVESASSILEGVMASRLSELILAREDRLEQPTQATEQDAIVSTILFDEEYTRVQLKSLLLRLKVFGKSMLTYSTRIHDRQLERAGGVVYASAIAAWVCKDGAVLNQITEMTPSKYSKYCHACLAEPWLPNELRKLIEGGVRNVSQDST